jgi:hypothetical protein
MLDQVVHGEKINYGLDHDINSSIGALLSAFELVKDEWQANPELVDRILPLTVEKIIELQLLLQNYPTTHQKLPLLKNR